MDVEMLTLARRYRIIVSENENMIFLWADFFCVAIYVIVTSASRLKSSRYTCMKVLMKFQSSHVCLI